mgnify:CR=1 FL=1
MEKINELVDIIKKELPYNVDIDMELLSDWVKLRVGRELISGKTKTMVLNITYDRFEQLETQRLAEEVVAEIVDKLHLGGTAKRS